MRTRISIFAALGILLALVLSDSPAQEGAAEKIGRRIDRGLEQLSQEVQEAWTDVRAKVDKLGVQGRVYGRLRWDKALAEEPIEVDVEGKDDVVLSGRVPDEETRQKALRLARDTVGVREVLDRLQIVPRQPQKGQASDK
jgi:osmotically-inducible protein OsmY